MIIELKRLVAPKAMNTPVNPYIITENGLCTVASCCRVFWLAGCILRTPRNPKKIICRVRFFKHNISFLIWLVPALTLGEGPSDGSFRARSSKLSIYVYRTRLFGSDQISVLRSWVDSWWWLKEIRRKLSSMHVYLLIVTSILETRRSTTNYWTFNSLLVTNF